MTFDLLLLRVGPQVPHGNAAPSLQALPGPPLVCTGSQLPRGGLCQAWGAGQIPKWITAPGATAGETQAPLLGPKAVPAAWQNGKEEIDDPEQKLRTWGNRRNEKVRRSSQCVSRRALSFGASQNENPGASRTSHASHSPH